MSDSNLRPQPASESALIDAFRARTPARILVGRAGPGYRTATQLELRADHAAAIDAVHAELDAVRDFGAEFCARWRLFEVPTQAGDKRQHLLRPDLGRKLSPSARTEVAQRCSPRADLQIAIGDGLSAAAVVAQVPRLLPLVAREAEQHGLRVGSLFVIRYCRVGVLNDSGDLLDPAVAVLLIGERPGLATAESLSAYLTYRPRAGHTDAQRNLVSNIHDRGVTPEDAARRIIALAGTMIRLQTSGVAVKEDVRSGIESEWTGETDQADPRGSTTRSRR